MPAKASSSSRRRIRGLPAFGSARATVVARTELGASQNEAALASYTASGVVVGVRVHDGDYDDACAAMDGRTFALDQAPPSLQHPNCTFALLVRSPTRRNWRGRHERAAGLTVIIPTQGRATLARALASIADASQPHDVEVIVCADTHGGLLAPVAATAARTAPSTWSTTPGTTATAIRSSRTRTRGRAAPGSPCLATTTNSCRARSRRLRDRRGRGADSACVPNHDGAERDAADRLADDDLARAGDRVRERLRAVDRRPERPAHARGVSAAQHRRS
jgi:hypothetical protein